MDKFIILSLVGIGAFILLRKSFGEDSPELNPTIPLNLKTANPASLPIVNTINSDELRVMQYADIMMYEGQRQGIDPSIIAGIIRAESSGIASTKTWESNVKDYSYGLMQMLPATALMLKNSNSWLKYDGYPESLFIPDISIEIGTAYLRRNFDRYLLNPVYNPISDMIAAYNAGSAFFFDGSYTNSKGDPKVQVYVDNVFKFKFRFRMMFEYLYDSYYSLFPASYWGR